MSYRGWTYSKRKPLQKQSQPLQKNSPVFEKIVNEGNFLPQISNVLVFKITIVDKF